MRCRALAVWVVLLAAYAGTIGMRAFGASEYGGDEPHYLLAAQSLAEDGNPNVFDEYELRSYEGWYPYVLAMHGTPDGGVLYEPHGLGFPVLITPAWWLGGAHGVELFLAAIAALAMALVYPLALRVVPDPWALGAVFAVGLSPPLLAYGTAVYPEMTAAALLAGAALLALRVSERPTRASVLGCFGLLALLPWLGTGLIPAGLVIGAYALRRLRRERHGLLALLGVEVAAFSAALYVGVNEGFYGRIAPYAAGYHAESAVGAGFPLGYLDRSYRLVALLVDQDYGLLRWAPVFALGGLGVWLLYQRHREGLGRAGIGFQGIELAAGLCAATAGAQYLVATFLAPTMFGFWFPPRHLMAVLPLAVPLVAWGLRRVPRAGSALALVTLGASLWLYLDVRLGSAGLAAARPDAPWGPLVHAFPFFGESPLPYVLAGLVGLALLVIVWRESRRWREPAGAASFRQPD